MKTSKLSLKWLDAFLLTARTGAVQDAAEEAGLSVSTVSHHLRSLEDTLGVTLFDHTRRPMRLTSAGAVFYSHVDKAMRILRRAEMEAQSGDLIDTRAMSLAMVEDFDSEIGPELARALAAGMPKCQFRHLTRPSHEILDMIRDQEVEIGIAARPQYISEDIHELPLMTEPFVLALPSAASLVCVAALAPPFFILPFSCCGGPPLFILPLSFCGSAPAFFTAYFSLRQRPRFLYCPFLLAAAPCFFLPNSRSGSAPSFYPAHFSLRQHPRFLYCPFLVAAAPRFLYCPFLVAAAPRFLYCPFLVAAAPTLFILTNSCCGSNPASYTAHFSLRQRPAFYTAWCSLWQRLRF